MERERGQKDQGRVLVVCVWGGRTLAHADVDAVGTGCVCEGGQGAMAMHCPSQQSPRTERQRGHRLHLHCQTVGLHCRVRRDLGQRGDTVVTERDMITHSNRNIHLWGPMFLKQHTCTDIHTNTLERSVLLLVPHGRK